jgi:putative spermidine/putrescine transport system ATP-binding protein
MRENSTKVELHDVSKRFGTAIAVKPTQLTVEPGEIMCLLGPSGCGKTTLLRMIAGLESVEQGRVCFDGVDVSSRPVESRGVGMVFQNYALFPSMNVAANIAYGLRMQGMPLAAQRSRVAELLEVMQLNGLESRSVHQLSGGQRQRVALARAVAPRPRVLLLDEPLAALDTQLKEVLRDELAAMLRELGITAVLVTHDQTEAMAIADRLAVMSNGQLEQVGTAREIYQMPASLFVARFVGQVNQLAVQHIGGNLHWMGKPLLESGSDARHALIRPEHVQVGATDESGWPAQVEQITYLGSFTRLSLRVAGGAVLTAQVPAGVACARGDQLRIDLPSHHLLLLP